MDDHLNVCCNIKDLAQFRIDSFNCLIKNVEKLCSEIDPIYLSNGRISITKVEMKQIEYPMNTRHRNNTVYPCETRLRLATYLAEFHVELCYQRNQDKEYFTRIFYVPAMVKSDVCFLKDLKEEELIRVKEDTNDPGGYFIVKGKERILRHFVVRKRNFVLQSVHSNLGDSSSDLLAMRQYITSTEQFSPLAVIHSKWCSYRKGYSEYGIIVESVRDEFIMSTTFIHYLIDGNFEIRLYSNLKPIYIQVCLLLKSLVDKSDREILEAILKYDEEFPRSKLTNMIQAVYNEKVYSHHDAKTFLGKEFLRILNLPHQFSYVEAADYVLKKSLLVHLETNEEKFEFICFSLCKLHSVVIDKSRPDDQDNPVFHEILSNGQIYFLILKDLLKKYLKSVGNNMVTAMKQKKPISGNLKKYCNMAKCITPEIASVISTGNFVGQDYGLRSNTGYTIPLKRTNMFQLVAQFRAICKFSVAHFLKDTRLFYPESWGFICPTETPEGENTGLYNQLASQCKIVNLSSKKIDETIGPVLLKKGVLSLNEGTLKLDSKQPKIPILIDGRLIGWVCQSLIMPLLRKLRRLKSQNDNKIPYHTEIVYLDKNQKLFPSLYIFSSSCRLIRKIFNEHTEKVEYIGMLEQVFFEDSSVPEVHSYSEIASANILSLAARLIPFCENNQAVRNIYSSVKIKQALGLPFLNFNGRSDTKVYQLLYGHHPIVSNKMYLLSNLQSYPCGTNVIVAVISYSGYDMEDALVLNKASVERGLMQNMVYKTFFYDLKELSEQNECNPSDLELKRDVNDPKISYILDKDGLPYIGIPICPNSPILSLYNKKSKQYIIERYAERHMAYVHDVRLMGDVPSSSAKNIPKASKKISITVCIKEVPKLGDKFNTRHGGKGVCGKLMEAEDMPFSANGMIPDILFNPHGLPSRMSIGLLFEIGSSKASIYKGEKCYVEPFESKNCETYEDIGKALTDAGLDFYGTETFYSGMSGEELTADIFCGSVYYLRLHHLAAEKYQVQSIGIVDERTNQPINPGRSGAVKFGEMEKDAILSHGAMVLTLDRLLLNSDKCSAFVCRRCHLLIPPPLPPPQDINEVAVEEKYCKLCHKESDFKIQIPYVLVYLITELSVLGIKLKLSDR